LRRVSRSEPPRIDLSVLKDLVAPSSFARGAHYARQHAVIRFAWDPAENALDGTVHGSTGEIYETTAYFVPSRWNALVFEQGQCSCPVGLNCKHVVALVLTAANPTERRRPERRAVTWEQTVQSLLDSPGAGGDTPLAVELSVQTFRGTSANVSARLVRPGKNGWVAGGLTWTRLGQSYYSAEFRAEQVRLLRELYALYRSGRTGSGYGEETSINVGAFESRQLWPLLDEAAEIGIRLVHSRKRLGDLPPYTSAEVCLDASRDKRTRSLALAPVVRVDEPEVDPVPLRFIGAEGHGLVYVDRADHRAGSAEWPLRLARLVRPVPERLQRMVLEGGRLEVPAAERAWFVEGYYPRLRRLAPVTSADGSFEPPTISEPTLVLRASYGEGHELDVDWEWVYQVGESRLRAPLAPGQPGGEYRDVAAEQEILAGLDFTPERAVLAGLDTMRFTTEVLPLLADQDRVAVEISGEPVDYREAGDTLRIGVSTDELDGETDWFDLGITITVEDREVPFLDVFLALSQDQTHLLLTDGAYFSLHKPELRALRGLIEEARALQDRPGSLKISRFQVDLWEELAALGVVEREATAWRQQVDALRAVESVGEQEPPATLAATLRPYQLDGFRWLSFLWEYRLGGILADDMGLGKTVQSLALICQARAADPAAPPFLVAAPTSVVSNWAAETAKFAPALNVVAITDTLRRRGQDLAEAIAGADLVVTSYTLLRLDIEAYAGAGWSGLILDEAQYTKNHQSKIYQCLRRIPALVKLAITGTPMENNLMELWSLLSITAPGLFPSPTRFADYYAKPIEKNGDAELLAQLRRRIKPLVKRRTKEQVAADLPAKQEQVLEVDLHPKHRKLYQTHLQRERQKVLGLIDDMNRNRFTILRSLTLLRQLSLHAALVDEAHADLPCAKLDTLLEQLHDVIDGGHRALVFSQFTGFLAQVRARLDAAGIPYCYLDGKTRNRADVLARFKDGAVPVFLISLKAGGFGLNLTEADYCFLLDPWWNPATEAQAVDRTHRIGQTRNVMVYRLIARDTIEEKVMALKARKAELFASVMDDGNAFGTTLDADDIRGLFA
jgi:superfamily II DNA or RNA helicase